MNACGSNSVVTMMLCCMQRGAFTSRDSNCILRPKNTRVWWTGSQNIHHLSSSATLVCVCVSSLVDWVSEYTSPLI